MRLSTAKIQNFPSQKKTVRLFDGRGLYLEIAPTGSRWWRFKYRFAGKEKRISLGVYPDVGLKKARDRRDEMRKLVADGIDPSAARKQEKLMARRTSVIRARGTGSQPRVRFLMRSTACPGVDSLLTRFKGDEARVSVGGLTSINWLSPAAKRGSGAALAAFSIRARDVDDRYDPGMTYRCNSAAVMNVRRPSFWVVINPSRIRS
jgi:hypothetical protein